MHMEKGFWARLVSLANYLVLSPFQNDAQQPLPGALDAQPVDLSVYRTGRYSYVTPEVSALQTSAPQVSTPDVSETPELSAFTYPPEERLVWKVNGNFMCNYTKLGPDWERCNTRYDRGCWLRNRKSNSIPPYSINTNYEEVAPPGILREYEFNITDGTWNTDGYPSQNMKLINGSYPGPWIQACWGDRIRVKINNHLAHNGTAIHWHGIRQHKSMHMDGVPGITQCPIAPDDYFVYEFDTTQYGDSWYHSHYSVQYADGMLGPMTIYGPSTAPYDNDPTDFSRPRPDTPEGFVDLEDRQVPLMMSDWFHSSSFGVIHGKQNGYGTILLNGRGDISKFKCANKNCSLPYPKPTEKPPPIYELHFEPRTENELSTPKRYLLRLINTSFSTTFVFSIDHHTLQIVSADFVPVIPTEPQTHVLVGIGQRYNVIVTADPVSNNGTKPPSDGNFWIRTTVANCFNFVFRGVKDYDKTGILRYKVSNSTPVSEPWSDIEKAAEECKDERNLIPKLPWYVPRPSNSHKDSQDWGELFDVQRTDPEKFPPPDYFPLASWDFRPSGGGNGTKFNPLQIDYNKTTFLNLDNINEVNFEWPKSWVIVPENYSENDWVYLGLAGPNRKSGGAHPIHLHGHDFAEIASAGKAPLPDNPKDVEFKTDNPMRRDVVLLPNQGYVIIAFKVDNPGSWIMHCHIAFHASEGLALQILERQSDANKMWPKTGTGPGHKDVVEAQRVCKNWSNWQQDCRKWWPGKNATLIGMDGKPGCWPQCSKTDPKQSQYACAAINKTHVFMDDSGI